VSATARSRGYADPILAGVVLGAVLFAAILIAGRGIGASGAFAAAGASAVHAVAPAYADSQAYLSTWVSDRPGGLLGDWIVVELLAVVAGGWLSARLAGRVRARTERLGGESGRRRLVDGLVGGALMGAGARLAHGCTSGLALTGGALLATGAWLFIPLAFASAFLVAWLRRRRVLP
jgi:uncharacterized protein